MIKVIGIIGHPGSGKDTTAEFFAAKGFRKISLGDVLREKMRELGIPTDRAHIHEFVKKQRESYGNSYPVNEVVEKITEDTVVAGFRNTEEVKKIKERFGKDFVLIAVNAPASVRYERAKGRNRAGDNISFEQFTAEENAERADDSGSHEVDLVVKMADMVIENDGTLEDPSRKVDKFLESALVSQ